MNLLTSSEVCLATGCTYRELDHWIQTGLVSCTVTANGTGTTRRFNADETRWIAAVVQMRGAGLRVDAIRRALDRGQVPELLDGIERRLEDWRQALPGWAAWPIGVVE